MKSIIQHQLGFTMVELLVVMVIIALLGGVVVPNISSYINSRTLAEQRKSLATEIAALPAKAHFTQQAISINSSDQLALVTSGQINKDQITITQPIKVLSNGFCKGGELTLSLAGNNYVLSVNPPLCSVTM